MPKKPDLRAALTASATGRSPEKLVEQPPQPLLDTAQKKPARATYQDTKSRTGKKMIAGYFPTDVHRNLKMIGVQRDMNIQDIVTEALSDFLKKHGYPEISASDK